MSLVVAGKVVKIFPLTAFDLRFPVALWIGDTGAVVGDVSGGSLEVSLKHSPAFPEALFSIEDVSISTTRITLASGVSLQLSTYMQGFVIFGGFTMIAAPSLQAIAGRLTDVIWNSVDGTAWQLYVQFANPTAGDTCRVFAWGYMWDKRANQLLGGPIRPGENLP